MQSFIKEVSYKFAFTDLYHYTTNKMERIIHSTHAYFMIYVMGTLASANGIFVFEEVVGSMDILFHNLKYI